MFAKGMTLIEVLVASVILGTGIVCLLALQTTALGMGITSGYRHQASLLLLELSELTYISPGAFRQIDPVPLVAGNIGSLPVCSIEYACLPATFAASELSNWGHLVRRRLPEAQIDIQREIKDGQIRWVVSLRWYGPQDSSQNRLQAELSI
jgi:type IV pilus assembly protein PilV